MYAASPVNRLRRAMQNSKLSIQIGCTKCINKIIFTSRVKMLEYAKSQSNCRSYINRRHTSQIHQWYATSPRQAELKTVKTSWLDLPRHLPASPGDFYAAHKPSDRRVRLGRDRPPGACRQRDGWRRMGARGAFWAVGGSFGTRLRFKLALHIAQNRLTGEFGLDGATLHIFNYIN